MLEVSLTQRGGEECYSIWNDKDEFITQWFLTCIVLVILVIDHVVYGNQKLPHVDMDCLLNTLQYIKP